MVANLPYATVWSKSDHVTRLGHGPFAFRFESWDGARWRVRVDTRGYHGWHGFDLEPTAHGCRLVHTLELELHGAARVIWPACFNAIHDWAVEAMFDRVEEALRTGEMPATTRRPMALPAALRMSLVRRVIRRKRRDARYFA